jgi:alpha-glucosidase (family GH31 glycosyl hydrolase)
MLKFAISDGTSGTIERDCTIELQAGDRIEFDLASGGHWFGHGFNHVQSYPLETGRITAETFAVNNIQSPIWMCSNGVALLADTKRLLRVMLNENGDGKLRVVAANDGLCLKIWKRPTLPEAQQALLAYLGWPNQVPDENLLGDSLFCTWTQYPRCVTQERILGMAREIHARKYPCSKLIIDDRWESCFGELSFSKDFADPAAMIREIHQLGIGVWLWVTPFVNQEAAGFNELAQQKILVPAKDGKGAALFKWWGGTAGLIDVTSPQGRDWLRGKLRTLMTKYGVDGFKIDGGDFKYQPSPETADWHEFLGESGYSDALLALFEELVPNACESRTAWLSQRRSILWRQGGKDSHWGEDNGLAAMVRLALQLSLLGYDLQIPDMIPGRVQTLVADFPLPTDELIIRWTEATAFMPFMQYSYFPWNYAPETERVLHAYALLHKCLQAYLAGQAKDRSAPLLRPVWYDAPQVPELFAIADEFLLGTDLLAAPVLQGGVVTRDVLLPPGDWRDAWTGQPLTGGWQRNYPAPCPGLPLFVRAERAELAKLLRENLALIVRGGMDPLKTSTNYSAGLNRDISVTG